jgi:preprotein translocase subunit Sss1
MKKLGIFLIILPFLLLLINIIVVHYNVTSDENRLAKGTCIETFSVEHWHKHSPPTTSVHSVVRNGMQVYIVDGNCYSKTKAIPWEDEHSFANFMAGLGLIVWGIIAFVVVVIFIYTWVMFVYTLITIKPDQKLWETFWDNFFSKD